MLSRLPSATPLRYQRHATLTVASVQHPLPSAPVIFASSQSGAAAKRAGAVDGTTRNASRLGELMVVPARSRRPHAASMPGATLPAELRTGVSGVWKYTCRPRAIMTSTVAGRLPCFASSRRSSDFGVKAVNVHHEDVRYRPGSNGNDWLAAGRATSCG